MTTKPYQDRQSRSFDYVELGMLNHAVNTTLNNITVELAEQNHKVVQARLEARHRKYLELNQKLIDLLAHDPQH